MAKNGHFDDFGQTKIGIKRQGWLRSKNPVRWWLSNTIVTSSKNYKVSAHMWHTVDGFKVEPY